MAQFYYEIVVQTFLMPYKTVLNNQNQIALDSTIVDFHSSSSRRWRDVPSRKSMFYFDILSKFLLSIKQLVYNQSCRQWYLTLFCHICLIFSCQDILVKRISLDELHWQENRTVHSYWLSTVYTRCWSSTLPEDTDLWKTCPRWL